MEQLFTHGTAVFTAGFTALAPKCEKTPKCPTGEQTLVSVRLRVWHSSVNLVLQTFNVLTSIESHAKHAMQACPAVLPEQIGTRQDWSDCLPSARLPSKITKNGPAEHGKTEIETPIEFPQHFTMPFFQWVFHFQFTFTLC